MEMNTAAQFSIDDDDDQVFEVPVDDETTGAIPLASSVHVESTDSDDHHHKLPEALPLATENKVKEDTVSHPLAVDASFLSSSTNTTGIPDTLAPLVQTREPSSPTARTTSVKSTLTVQPTSDNLKYHPEVLDLRVRRKRRTAVLGVVGGVAGLLILGPIGGIAAGACAAIGTKAAGTRKEKRKVKELQKKRDVHQAMERAEAQHAYAQAQQLLQADLDLGDNLEEDEEEGEGEEHGDDSTITTTSSSNSMTASHTSLNTSSLVTNDHDNAGTNHHLDMDHHNAISVE